MFFKIYLPFIKLLKWLPNIFLKFKMCCKLKTLKNVNPSSNENSKFLQNCLPMFKLQLKLCEILKATPIIMEQSSVYEDSNFSSNFKFKMTKSKMLMVYIKLQTFIMFINILICMQSFYCHYKNINFTRIILSAFFLIKLCMFNLIRVAVINSAYDMVKLLNAIKTFGDLGFKGYF